ncbi:hypothetical protein [Candidatus Absconditicoccus praedator]|uniref:hypothetical protein n=1 Tax=Candidatus Absconditicoccus praedator TaxID=2735562 RepID=UPI001E29CBE8|nr:hypothetical protein [Candidatus Absconditicoccus praedator]UFX83087.1 hypothetical protein HLG78_03050 [Candidatus Absconditicoccus praedator]
MINKIPNTTLKKWNRFDGIEKGFIIYLLVLIITIFSFPIIEVSPTGTDEVINFFIFNSYTITTFLIISIFLVFLVLWNTSFRFKKLIHILVGFKENDAILNFGILLLITISYISISDVVNLLRENVSYSIGIGYGYYITGFVLIIGLIWNLFLALNLSKDKKKNKLINVIQKGQESNSQKDHIKSLFDK